MATTPAERKFLFLDDSSASIKQRNDESDFANDDLFFKWLAGEPNAETNEKYVEARIKSNVFGFNDLLSTYAIHALCEKRNSDCSEGIYCQEIQNASSVITKRYLDAQLVRGVEIEYTCNDGYGPTTPTATKCTKNGWSGNARCYVNLKFQLTDEVGNFDQARANCRALGGDLVTENLGPGGSHYHEQIREAAKGEKAFVGVRAVSGDNGWEWKFVTGGVFDADNAGNVFKWAAGEPQGLDQGQCVYVGYPGDEFEGSGGDEMQLETGDDSFCNHDVNQIKGLCQLPANDD